MHVKSFDTRRSSHLRNDIEETIYKELFTRFTGKGKKRYLQKIELINGLAPYSIRKKDWTSTKVDDYPSVTYPDIVNYLIFSPNPYSSDGLKSYKGLDAYNQFQEGWVSDVKVKMAKDDVAVVGARVSNFSHVVPKAQTHQYPS